MSYIILAILMLSVPLALGFAMQITKNREDERKQYIIKERSRNQLILNIFLIKVSSCFPSMVAGRIFLPISRFLLTPVTWQKPSFTAKYLNS